MQIQWTVGNNESENDDDNDDDGRGDEYTNSKKINYQPTKEI